METRNVSDLFIPEDVGIVWRIFQSTTEMVSRLLQENKHSSYLEQRQNRQVVRLLQGLLLWGDDNKVADGRLDTVLQRSRNIQAITLTPLHCFAETFLRGASHPSRWHNCVSSWLSVWLES